MKHLLILTLFIVETSVAQQAVYPLEIGNVWEYHDCYDSLYPYQVKAISETTMTNGLTYTHLHAKVSSGVVIDEFLRQSGQRVYAYLGIDSSELTRYDFSKTTGDTVAMNYYPGDTTIVRVQYYGIQTMFGKLRRQWGFREESISSSAYVLREVTDSIGLTFVEYEGGAVVDCLGGALIGGVVYGVITGVPYFRDNVPQTCTLSQNYPNPFNPSTSISFCITKKAWVNLSISNLLGQRVAVLVNEIEYPGTYTVSWKPDDLPSGIYFYLLRAGTYTNAKRLLYIK